MQSSPENMNMIIFSCWLLKTVLFKNIIESENNLKKQKPLDLGLVSIKLFINNPPHRFQIKYMYLVVMSPSRAGSSHTSSWRIFSSARDLFDYSSELKIDWKTSWNFNFQLKTYLFIIFFIKLTKLWIWIKFSPLKTQKFR